MNNLSTRRSVLKSLKFVRDIFREFWQSLSVLKLLVFFFVYRAQSFHVSLAKRSKFSSFMEKFLQMCKYEFIVATSHIHELCTKKRWKMKGTFFQLHLAPRFVILSHFSPPWWWLERLLRNAEICFPQLVCRLQLVVYAFPPFCCCVSEVKTLWFWCDGEKEFSLLLFHHRRRLWLAATIQFQLFTKISHLSSRFQPPLFKLSAERIIKAFCKTFQWDRATFFSPFKWWKNDTKQALFSISLSSAGGKFDLNFQEFFHCLRKTRWRKARKKPYDATLLWWWYHVVGGCYQLLSIKLIPKGARREYINWDKNGLRVESRRSRKTQRKRRKRHRK